MSTNNIPVNCVFELRLRYASHNAPPSKIKLKCTLNHFRSHISMIMTTVVPHTHIPLPKRNPKTVIFDFHYVMTNKSQGLFPFSVGLHNLVMFRFLISHFLLQTTRRKKNIHTCIELLCFKTKTIFQETTLASTHITHND